MSSSRLLIVGIVVTSGLIIARTESALPSGTPGAVCPLPGGADDPCAALQDVDCVGLDDEQCRPTQVQLVGAQFVATTCGCIAPGDKCGPIDITSSGDEIRCPGGCPAPNPPGDCFIHADGVSLDRDFASVGDPDIPPGATLTCACTEPVETCPLPSDPATDPCAALQSTECTEFETPTEHCFPVCVNFFNGTVTGLQCECSDQDECHVLVIDGGVVPTCIGGCPPGEECIETVSDNPVGGIDICCRCEPAVGACCRDSDNDGIPDDCVQISSDECAAIGGTFHGVGTPCGGPGACCVDADGDGIVEFCLEMDEVCCEALMGQFTAGGMCQGTGACCFDLDGDGILETCFEMDGTCCEISGGTFQGVGTICLGDSNGDGFDDTCVPPPDLCSEPAGQDSCALLQDEQCIGSADEQCRPTEVQLMGTQFVATACDCIEPGDKCGPMEILQGGAIVRCPGGCPPPNPPGDCFVHANGVSLGSDTVFADDPNIPPGAALTCDCTEPVETCPLPGDPATDPCAALQSNECTEFATPTEQCFPVCVNFNGGTVTGLECDCRDQDECHVLVIDGVVPTCTGGCPPGEDCIETVTNSPLGGIDICCRCEPGVGACCRDSDNDGIPDDCVQISADECAAIGGTFHGVGTPCGGFGSCCLDLDGVPGFETCLEMDAVCCEALLGQFTAGGMCLGDGNGNGIDDACDDFCPVPPAQNYCQELQLEDCRTDDPTEACLPTCVRVIITEEIVLTFDKGQPGPITIPGVGTFEGDRVCLAGLNATEMPTQQTEILNFFKDTGDVVMTYQFVDTLVPIPPGPKDCGPDRVCDDADNCVFDGLPNIALGMAHVSITPAPECNLVVSNIGSSGKDGVRQDLPPGTTEMASGLATPNFSLSKPGTHADLRMIGDVQEGLISRMLIDNIAPGILQVVGDISPVGVTQYAVRIFNGGDSVVDATGLDQAVVTFPKDDIVVVDCKLVTIVQLVIEQCDCYDGSSCGPVQITPVGPNDPPDDFELSCNGDCPGGSECQVLINGVASGQNTVLASDVPNGRQVKCGCIDVPQFCDPEPICQPLLDQCLSDDTTLSCRALCVQMVLDDNGVLVPEALLCDCLDPNDPSCGPVTVVPLPPPAEGFNLRCDGACELADETCQVLIDGVATGLDDINSSDVPVGSEVCCDCIILPPPECPEPNGQTICADLQDEQCLSTDPNSECLPLCVRVINAGGTPEAVFCDCIDADDQSCGPVIITPINDPPSDFELSCVGQCAAADETCEVFIDGNQTGQSTVLVSQIAVGSQVCCDCAPDPPLPTCPLPPNDFLCEDLQELDCPETDDTNALCLASCVVFDPLTGLSTASLCDCQAEGDCHVILDAAGQPICDGTCADGTACEPTQVVLADGTIEFCCGCCPPNDLIVELDTGVDDDSGALLPLFGNDDTWTVTGEPPPVGPLPRPATVIPTHPAWSLLPGTQWVAANVTGPNGVYTYEKCFCLDERATNAQLDLLLLADDQAFVFLNGFLLGATPSPGFFNPPTPIFTNDQTLFLPGQINCVTVEVENQFGVVTGFDLAGTLTAENGLCCCGPTPDRSACQEVLCPNGAEECQARCIEFDPNSGQVTVLDCECRDADECRPTAEGGGDAHCIGGCPAGFDCIKDLEIDPVTGIQTLCCDCTPQLGACCFDIDDGPLAYDTCQDGFSEVECLAAGGFFNGPGSVCTLEACCLPGGFCQSTDPDCCLASGGEPQGAGTNCGNTECPQDEPGACCFDAEGDGINESCLVVTETECEVLGGTFHGVGSTCTVSGACCFDADGDGIDESCQVMDELCCEDLGGVFQGPDTQCKGQGACCFGFTGGSCVVVDGVCCDELEGGTFFGVGSICLGDSNNDGIDDRCQCPADINRDGTVNPVDLALLLASWGPCQNCPADLNHDGVVNPVDLAGLLASWGPCP